MSPVSIALEVVRGVCIRRLPDVTASNKPMCEMVPQESVACGKVTSAEEVTMPPEAVVTASS
jgi:uncharacterized lipoprotein YbaY